MSELKGKKVVVTGVCGTVGSELLKQLVANDCCDEIICIDNNETELFFREQQYQKSNAVFSLCDIRDRDRLKSVMRGVDIVFHAAAYKHVVLCERAPDEAVGNNIHGVQNIISAAEECGVSKVIFTSSDKAVNPTSVMGTSKLMGERLITAANSCVRDSKGPVFSCVRFGNVLGSRGSVIPIFKRQVARGGPVTLTEYSMTRFIMSISEAVKLVIGAAALAQGGEVFVTKMPVIRIKDLAEVMIDYLAPQYGYDPSDIDLVTIGSKPGEKLYEELMSQEECRRALELEEHYVVTPAFKSLYRQIDYNYDKIVSDEVSVPYNSHGESPMSKGELLELLLKFSLIQESESYEPAERYWPDPNDNKQN